MIGIISAMQEEVQSLLNTISNVQTVEKGRRTYYIGRLFHKEVVIVFSRWGKVAAAATTVQLINDFNLDELLFTGVAGAIKPELSIGDIVIGKNLYQHDVNAAPFFEPYEIPILKKSYIETKGPSKLQNACKQFVLEYNSFIETDTAAEFEIKKPEIHYGDIASGDQFISSIDKIKELNKGIPSAVCVEMEGAAVGQVCYEYNIPFSIIRIISDESNNNAHIDFPKFADKIASRYAFGILKYYFA